MPPPVEIPGYYFDEERGRYFKIVNGAIPPPTGEAKYHNNSIQAVKRTQDFDKQEEKNLQSRSQSQLRSRSRSRSRSRLPLLLPSRSKQKIRQNSNDAHTLQDDNHVNIERIGDGKIKNPMIKKPTRGRDLSLLKKFTFDTIGLVNLKAGSVNIQNLYFNGDFTDLIRTGKFQKHDNFVLPQCRINNYVDGIFVIERAEHGISELFEPLPFKTLHFRVQDETLLKFGDDLYYRSAEGIVNLEIEDVPKFFKKSQVQYCTRVISGNTNDLLDTISFYEFNSFPDSRVLRFHTYKHGIGFQDCTVAFMNLVKDGLRQYPRRAKILEKSFGLHLVEFVNYAKLSIEEVNEALAQARKGNNPRFGRSMLDRFLDSCSKATNQPEMIYHEPLENESVYQQKNIQHVPRIINGIISSPFCYLLTSDGDLISFKHFWKPDGEDGIINNDDNLHKDLNYNQMKDCNNYTNLSSFSNFQIIDLKSKIPENAIVRVSGTVSTSKVFVSTRSNILEYDRMLDGKVIHHKLTQIRNFFTLSDNKLLVVRKDDIIFYYTDTKEIVRLTNYNNSNDAYQQFEVVQNHLVFNVGNKFMVYNLQRAFGDTFASLEIEFNFLKYGYLKDFHLIKIVDMGIQNGRPKLGFQHFNAKEEKTIFEAHVI
ncbi:hypothetical protein PVL30_002909 [Lodderomyces elongisporus]|uniref:uncharacterized protein n=1 Tax=Lodderomyces elongisporus TaxID=36914 RepID=UPI00292457C2|nr:uncharacterized protein PVL30_002909 [Lodderomyces elongisporus]WLF79158.1 hypothetical protein PVL30_002909 [Lodderomyces elongisporus]